MKLKAFRIQNYKVIDDSGWVQVDERVTALVGKNESGKTGALRSMWKSKNVANKKFDKLLDYPRERYAKERKGDQEVVALEFLLKSEESERVASLFEVPLPNKLESVFVRTSYKGEDETITEAFFSEDIERTVFRASLEATQAIRKVTEALASAMSTDDLSVIKAKDNALGSIDEKAPIWDRVTQAHLASFSAVVDKWVSQSPIRQSNNYAERQAVVELLAVSQKGDPSVAARAWVLENMPIFIYFDEYGQLETRIHLPAYIQRRKTDDVRTRTQTALFEKSNLDAEEILALGRMRQGGETDEQVQQRKDKRRALLDSASFGLTGEWIDWWSETRHRLHFDADGEDLVLKVSDDHNQFPIPFEERSHGFQWFFSFYLLFLVESAKAHKGAILLLDEPGLHLHPSLQSKLIQLFERISDSNQLIYSTHLPFLIDGEHLDRVRTVYLSGEGLQKSTLSNELRPAGDRDTLFPLQAAIGYSIAQTLFLGKRSVITEGIIDYWLIKALNEALGATGHSPLLHPETVLIPAGGTSRLMPLASIMFGALGAGDRQMLVLLDSDKEGVTAGGRFRDAFASDSRLLLLGDAIGIPGATIEDLLPRDDYVAAVKATGKALTLNTAEKKEATNLTAIQKAFERAKLGSFGAPEKAATALKIIEGWAKDPKSVPESTRKLATVLFDAINKKFENA